ncbi:MAG TPA: hypothetical protein VKR52_05855 [Terracidiphilus sp.]|nr:hypothetical protein [Terracidiphilus sp.]
MRYQVTFATLALVSALTIPVWAASPDDKDADQQSIAALEARINQAQPREQCYLYAELIHQMSEVSLRQYTAGDVPKASALLREIQNIAHKMHLAVGGNDKRLKNAEILLRRTAFRLNDLLHSSDAEDRALVEATLAQVNQADNDAMMQVFKK